MKITHIITQRNFSSSASTQIVYEWEDIIKDICQLQFIDDNPFRLKRPIRKRPFIANLFSTNKAALVFELLPSLHGGLNKKNIVPYIIDFFITKEELPQFYQAYRKNPLILISSKEAYDFLKQNNCPLPIAHCALSLPDQYKDYFNDNIHKKFDLVMPGRCNSVLKEFALRYKQEHPDFSLVIEDPNEKYRYITVDGELVSYARSREEYVDLVKQSRIGLYSTPSMDVDDAAMARTNGFNQVTPKLLEYIAFGCHVIGRYPHNSDTEFFDLPSIAPHVETYEDFARLIDKARTTVIDKDRYLEYLGKHCTSTRAAQLLQILNND